MYHRVQSHDTDDFVDAMEKMCNSMVWSFGTSDRIKKGNCGVSGRTCILVYSCLLWDGLLLACLALQAILMSKPLRGNFLPSQKSNTCGSGLGVRVTLWFLTGLSKRTKKRYITLIFAGARVTSGEPKFIRSASLRWFARFCFTRQRSTYFSDTMSCELQERLCPSWVILTSPTPMTGWPARPWSSARTLTASDVSSPSTARSKAAAEDTLCCKSYASERCKRVRAMDECL